MLSAFDTTAILAYKIMSDCDYFNKKQFTKDELENFYLSVLNHAKEIDMEINLMSEEQVSEIKKRLSRFCEIKEDTLEINSNLQKEKARKIGYKFIHGLKFPLYACCDMSYKEQLKADNTESSNLEI